MTPPAATTTTAATTDPPDTARRPRFGPIERCPRCGGTALDTIAGGDELTFRCTGCATTWRYELGHVLLTSHAHAALFGCTFPV